MRRSMTKLIRICNNRYGQLDKEQVTLASNLLDDGGVIAVPTDTIYGLAARADDSKAINRIYEIKNRDQSKPLAVCLSNLDQLNLVTDQILPQRILSSLLPGPITILLQRGKNLNKDLNPGLDTIGVRIPSNVFTTKLVDFSGPLALTSANRSGETSPLTIQDFEDLWPELDAVFDSGQLQKYLEDVPLDHKNFGSTVIDLSEPNTFKIVREGCSLNRTLSLMRRHGYKARK